MLRKLGLLITSLALAVTFSAATPRSVAAITCNDDPPYAVFYGNESGTGGRFVACHGVNYSSLTMSNGTQDCAGVIGGNSNDWDDCFTSVYIAGGDACWKLTVYSQSAYGGLFRRWLGGLTKQLGFTYFQWQYTSWESGSGMNDQISSLKWSYDC